jgi:hypothetical protein
MLGAQIDLAAAVPPGDPQERALLEALSREPRHIDEVPRASGLPSVTLALMDLKGRVREVGGLQYVRLREKSAVYEAEAARS